MHETLRLVEDAIFKLREAAQSYDQLDEEHQKLVRSTIYQQQGNFGKILFTHTFPEFVSRSRAFPIKTDVQETTTNGG